MSKIQFELPYAPEGWFDMDGSAVMMEEGSPAWAGGNPWISGAPPAPPAPPWGASPFSARPFNIIQADQHLTVQFDLNCSGILTGFPFPIDWHLRVLFEKVGGAPGFNPATLALDIPGVMGAGKVTGTPINLTAPVGHFAVPVDFETTGDDVFKVIATAVMHAGIHPTRPRPAGHGYTLAAGFAEIGLLQVVRD